MTASKAMYQLLVQNPEDVLAALAYSAYKHHELEVLGAIERTTGEPATELDLDRFYMASSTPAMLEMYEQKAKVLLNAFLEETLKQRSATLAADFAASTTVQALNAIQAKQNEKRTWKGWIADSLGNLAVNFLTILLIAGAVTGYKSMDAVTGNLGKQTGVLSEGAAATGRAIEHPTPPQPSVLPDKNR